MKLFKIEHSQWAYRFDLYFYGTAPCVLSVLLITCGPTNLRAELLSLTALGFVSWSLMEYVLHRFVLHGLAPFSRWHDEHHQRPTALICLPTAYSFGLIYLLVFLPSLGALGFWPAVALALGVLTGYAAYTLVHHATHHSKSLGHWFRRRKCHHALHHAMYKKLGAAGGYFGVTSNLWDRIFRTLVD